MKFDVTVIGGGPVGMFAAFYAGLRDAKVQLIESLPRLGGQVRALFPYKVITDVGGCAGVTGAELIQRLKRQLKMVNVVVRLSQSVRDVRPIVGGYRIVTNQSVTKTSTVIVATGIGAFTPRKLRAPNADRLTDHRLFYHVSNPKAFQNRTVLVAGGGNSAIDNALLLSKFAKQVVLLHRRNQFRGLEHHVDRLKRSAVKIMTPYLIRKLTPTGSRVLVTVKKMRTQHVFQTLKVDDLVINYGVISNNRSLQKWQVPLSKTYRKLKAGPKMMTNVPQVYTVGDVALYPGKDPLIATGMGEVPLAVNAAMRHLYPQRRLPLHSTMLH